MFHSIRWRIATAYILLILFTMGGVSLYLVNYVRTTLNNDLESQLREEVELVVAAARPLLEKGDQAGLKTLFESIKGGGGEARFTIIDKDGKAIADSQEDPSSLLNQKAYPEVGGALATGQGGKDRRADGPGGQKTSYLAVFIPGKDTGPWVARVALPATWVEGKINHILATIGISAGVVVFMSALVGLVIAGRTTRAIREVTDVARHLASGNLEPRVLLVSDDEAGDLARAFNTMADRLKAMVADLASERGMLSSILSTMSEGVVVTDGEGSLLLANPAAEEILGLPLSSSQGKSFIELAREHRLQQLVEDCLRRGQRQQGQFEVGKTGRFLNITVTPLAGDGLSGALLVFYDLTPLRHIEASRRELVTNISHELRTPLAAIRAASETLEAGALKNHQVAGDFLRRINVEAERMSRMIDEILQLSRLEAHQEAFHLAPISLKGVVEESVEEIRPQAERKGLTLELNVPEGLPTLLADAAKLRQVVSNLLDNAIKYTPRGGRVTVEAREAESGVLLSVSDTGAGIPPEHLPYIFERFYKVEPARDRGVGLGLAIARHIVKAHGGEIWAESQEGKGSTFSFSLPKPPQS